MCSLPCTTSTICTSTVRVRYADKPKVFIAPSSATIAPSGRRQLHARRTHRPSFAIPRFTPFTSVLLPAPRGTTRQHSSAEATQTESFTALKRQASEAQSSLYIVSWPIPSACRKPFRLGLSAAASSIAPLALLRSDAAPCFTESCACLADTFTCGVIDSLVGSNE